MNRRNSRLIFGTGIFCFIGMTALWLATAGDRAVAETEGGYITQSLSRSHHVPVELGPGISRRAVTFEQTDGLVQHLSVHVNLATQQVRGVKLYLTSPSGTRVMLVDGAHTRAASAEGLEGWFGFNGIQTTESLAAFAGEPLTGAWSLTVNTAAVARLIKWSLNADVGPNMLLAGTDTCDPYLGCPDKPGCDCTVNRSAGSEMGGLALMTLLGIWVIRRRSGQAG